MELQELERMEREQQRRERLQRVRKGHTCPKNTGIQSAEYGEVRKEGFTQVYVNGALGCIVTRRAGNDEDIV